jgi:hypothetical protein
MRICVSDPALLPDLLEFFESRAHAITRWVAPRELEVSLLGSFSGRAMRAELYLLMRAWENGRGAVVDFDDVCRTVSGGAPGGVNLAHGYPVAGQP